MNQEKIGKFIKNLRTKKGWTQEELAEKLYVRRQSISKWEIGKTSPDSEKFRLLSEIFDVSIDELILGEYISKKDSTAKSEELKIKIIDDANMVKSKNKLLKKIIIVLFIILIICFTLYYFVMTYNRFKMYYITGSSDGVSITDGLLFETNEKIFFQLGNVNIDKEEILSTTVYYIKDGDENLIYQSDDYDNRYKQDSKNYPEYFNTEVNNFIDNLYVKLKTKERDYNIKLEYRLDYINNKLFFEHKKNETPKRKKVNVANSDYQQLYDLLIQKDIMTYSFDYNGYHYDGDFTKEINKTTVWVVNKEDLSNYMYVFNFESNELFKYFLDESTPTYKCKKGDSCYKHWDEIVKNTISNIEKS